MAKKALVLLAQGFEEIEAATPVDVLRRAGVEVVAAGIGGTTIKGAHGLIYSADAELSAAAGDTVDAVVIPGGMPGAKNIGESAIAKKLTEAVVKSGRLAAAICAAPVFTLGSWGLLAGKKATCYTGMEGMFPSEVIFSAERVVTDGNIVTSRGPGTALEFSLTVAALLAGRETAEKVASDMIVK